MKKYIELVKIVDNLNVKLYENNPQLFDIEPFGFSLEIYNYCEYIKFNEKYIYNSEIDDSYDIENAGGLEEYCISKVKEYINNLKSIKI